MRNIKVVAAYDGTDFVGWQVQNGGRSVQGVLEDALFRIHRHPVTIIGAGRTDSGVHAAGQVFNFKSGIASIPADRYCSALNRLLPPDVRALESREAEESFDSRRHARLREYRYYIYQGAVVPPHLRLYSVGVRFQLDLRRLNAMASHLVGVRDFSSFAAQGDSNHSKIREIYSAAFYPEGPFAVFRITGSSFLWRMVRNIVGTLLGLCEDPPGKFREILDAKDRVLAGVTAPARGLFLHKVVYDDEPYLY